MAPGARSTSGPHGHVGKKRQHGRSPIHGPAILSTSPIPGQPTTGDGYHIGYRHPPSPDYANSSKRFKPNISVHTRTSRDPESPVPPVSHIGQGDGATVINSIPDQYSHYWHSASSELNPAESPVGINHSNAYGADFGAYPANPIRFQSQAHSHPSAAVPPHHLPHNQHISSPSRYHSHSPHSLLPEAPISVPEAFHGPTSVPAFPGVIAHPAQSHPDASSHQQPNQLIEYNDSQHYSPAEAYPYQPPGTGLPLQSPESHSHIWPLEISSSYPHGSPIPDQHHSSSGPAIHPNYGQPDTRQPHLSHHHHTSSVVSSAGPKDGSAFLEHQQAHPPAQYLAQPPPGHIQHWPGVHPKMSDSEEEHWRWENVVPGSEEQQKRALEMELAPRETSSNPRRQLHEPAVEQESEDDFEVVEEEGGEAETTGKALVIRRRNFTPQQREETSKTRATGACVRCKIQKIRCNGDPDSTCDKCHQVRQNVNKKVIHHVPCKRWKMQEVVWTRNGGLGLTKRWQGVDVKHIPCKGDIKISHRVGVKIFYTDHSNGVQSDLCPKPLLIDVHPFAHEEGDVLDRKWTRRINGKKYKGEVKMPAYCLVSVERTKEALEQYFKDHAVGTLEEQGQQEDGNPFVSKMFRLAAEHYQGLPEGPERELMFDLFTLWFALRFSTGSAFLDNRNGHDTLDIKPEVNPNAPLFDKVSVPRMITAQIDSIIAKFITQPLSKKIFSKLETAYRQNNPELWLTLFLSTFILLHEVGHSTRDRFRHARQSDYLQRYTQPQFVQDLHHGANIVLIHWQYYKANVSPASGAWRTDKRDREVIAAEVAALKAEKKKPPKSKVLVTPAQEKEVKGLWAEMQNYAIKFEEMPAGGADHCQQSDWTPGAWEEPMYYLEQIFRDTWHPSDGYIAPGTALMT